MALEKIQKANDIKELTEEEIAKKEKQEKWMMNATVAISVVIAAAVFMVLPYFLSACRLSLGMCWKAGVAAEVIGVPSGSIGEKLYNAKIYLNTPDLFAWTIVIIVISFVFEKCFLGIVSRVVYMIEHK